jgi:rsbT antagonist protein RsbS
MNTEPRIPIVEIYGVLLVPIQVALSDSLVLQLKDDLGQAIQRTGARGLIIDLSGVDIVDSYLSRAIHDICLIARLMGVHGVLSGMDPTMAITLVEMGLGLEGIDAARNIEDALEFLHEYRHRHEDEISEVDSDGSADSC